MSGILKFGLTGQDVMDLQRRLNCHSPTKIPLLVTDSNFGVFTMARVMEFQSQQRLSVDGVCGLNTFGRLLGGPTTCSIPANPLGRCILVDLIKRRLFAFLNGVEELRITPIHGGSQSSPSTRGVFPMLPRRLRHYTSSTYTRPPGNMDFSLFYTGVEAIHQGPPNVPSHGCIHVGPPHAERLFNWAGSQDVLVIIVKI